ncbi:hypothetical protein ACUNWD_17335 [Sunxiuqinia sp. A32]|uniref:hypothetical protein n=1 Tax=Sunxiuqinia sp. A32 TaxID=3461496 RepID=UPI00404653B7
MKKTIRYAIVFIGILTLSACATQSVGNVIDPPGFFYGLLHGFIILFSFIISLFTDYEIYAFPNAGGWYNFGFLLGVTFFFGGGGASAKKKRK